MFEEVRHKLASDGFAIIEGFLSDREIEELKKEVGELIKIMPDKENRTVFSTIDSENQQSKDEYFLRSADKISYFYEANALDEKGELLVEPHLALNKIGHALHVLNPTFRRVTLDERVKEICYQLDYKDPAIVQSMYIFKNPSVGGEVTPHQDASYIYTDPQSAVGFWIAIDDATLENGCLKFARGSHTGDVHRRYKKNPDKSSKELLIYDKPTPYYQKSSFQPVPVKKGSCVVIHGQVLHCSDPNKSSNSRHAYTFHVIEQKDTKYALDNWIQPPESGRFLSLYRNKV